VKIPLSPPAFGGTYHPTWTPMPHGGSAAC